MFPIALPWQPSFIIFNRLWKVSHMWVHISVYIQIHIQTGPSHKHTHTHILVQQMSRPHRHTHTLTSHVRQSAHINIAHCVCIGLHKLQFCPAWSTPCQSPTPHPHTPLGKTPPPPQSSLFSQHLCLALAFCWPLPIARNVHMLQSAALHLPTIPLPFPSTFTFTFTSTLTWAQSHTHTHEQWRSPAGHT